LKAAEMSISYFAADAGLEEERARLRLLERAEDPTTIRHLTRIGVGEGWRCLEVGAGGGSIARWLADRVGPTGQVVATDINPRFLDHLDLPNVEVRCHNIVEDGVEQDAYDLVHCRAVLMHLPDPEAVARKMARALRPGGWLLAEEGDYTFHASVDVRPLVTRRAKDYLRSAGMGDPFFGRLLPPLVARLGLTDTANEAVTHIAQGGSDTALFLEKTSQLLDAGMADNGLITEAEIAERGRILADPDFWFVNYMIVAAWGRRPT